MKRTFFRSYPQLLEDSYVLFLRWVIISTRQGHLKWNVKPGVIGTKARSMRFAFTTEETARARRSWNLFTVTDAGAELFRVTPRNRTSHNLPRHIVTLVGSLFREVSKTVSPIIRERKAKTKESSTVKKHDVKRTTRIETEKFASVD